MNRLRKTGWIVLLVAVLLTGCGKSVEKQIAEQLELGNKYLAEANYEQAIVAFNKVIELDEKNTAGYVGLMEAYLQNENTDEAVQCGESGMKKLDDDALRDKLLEAYQQKQVEIEDVSEKLSLYDKMLHLVPDQKAVYLELAELYEKQHDYEQGMEVLKNGIENISSPEELREKFREMVDSYREYLLDTIKKQFQTEKRGLAFGSYGANGEYGLFMLGRIGEAVEEDIYYCGDNGKVCEWLGTLRTSGFIIVENGTRKYFCPYSRTEGMIFGVEDGKPFTFAEKLEIPDGETEQIEAYFNEVVAQKVE